MVTARECNDIENVLQRVKVSLTRIKTIPGNPIEGGQYRICALTCRLPSGEPREYRALSSRPEKSRIRCSFETILIRLDFRGRGQAEEGPKVVHFLSRVGDPKWSDGNGGGGEWHGGAVVQGAIWFRSSGTESRPRGYGAVGK